MKVKFKVWDRENEVYLELSPETFIAYDGSQFQVFCGNENYGDEYMDFDLYMYSGQKDESGNEVYELIYSKRP